VRQCDDI
jgi:hypothetical protein